MKQTICDFNVIESVKPVIARKFYDTDSTEMIQMILKKNEYIPDHSVDWDAVFIVERGQLYFRENDKEIVIAEHDFVVSNRGNKHGFINRHEEEAVLLVIKLK